MKRTQEERVREAVQLRGQTTRARVGIKITGPGTVYRVLNLKKVLLEAKGIFALLFVALLTPESCWDVVDMVAVCDTASALAFAITE